MREHVVIEPSAGSIDFQRKDYDTTQVWFQHPRPAWIATLLPQAISDACSGSDFTYSTWRKFPLRDPADFTIPANEGVPNSCVHANWREFPANDVVLPLVV